MLRIPNTHSPEEVRRAFQRLGVDADALSNRVAGIDARVEDLEDATIYEAEAVENVAFGQPIYGVSGLPQAGVARADTTAKSRVAGLALAAATAGNTVTYLTNGRVEIEDWTAIAGTTNLAPNAVYYLDETGGITTVAPTEVGLYVTEIGRATETTVLNVDIKRPILL